MIFQVFSSWIIEFLKDYFLQILQNLEFTYAKFLLWSQKLW
jgi:hypothetical protein